MKIDLIRDEEVTHEGLEVSQMSFDMTKTAKLFHMLSSTLYSDKISSVIRELSSNAYDSHKQAGKLDVPFELTSPTYESQFFVIRDYGVGLTAEEAEKTILCYLGSSKDNSDEFIGGWGIGSKSPFAYAMNYEVIVYKDNQFAHYNCWKNESGIPEKTIIDSGYTDESNGVKMIIPVDASDIYDFESTLKKYVKWTNYNVRLNETVTPDEPIASKDMGDYTVKVYRGNGDRNLVYGGFYYPIYQCVNDRYDYSSTWSKLNEMLHVSYDLAFVIDEPNLVSFNMNREVIEQTPKSTSFIKKMIDEVYELANKRTEVAEKTIKEITDNTTETSTLSDFQDHINVINQKISETADSLDIGFADKDIELKYQVKGQLKTLHIRGIFESFELKLKLNPIEDQIGVCWSTRAKPLVSDRSSFRVKYAKNRTFLFFKAKNESDCIEQLKAHPDFKGFDLSRLVIKEMMNSYVTSPRRSGVSCKSTVPVVYCTHRKKRLSYLTDAIYIDADPNYILSDIETIYKLSLAKVLVFLRPSETTQKNVQCISKDEFEKQASEWFDLVCENFIPRRLMNQVTNFWFNNYYSFNSVDSDDKLIIYEIVKKFSGSLRVMSREQEREAVKKFGLDKYKEVRKAFKNFKEQHKAINDISKFSSVSLLKNCSDLEPAKHLINYLESKGLKL